LSYSVRTFQASSMRDALELVKRDLGPDAVILGTRTVSRGGVGKLAGRQSVEISAAPPGMATPAPRAGRPRKSPPPAEPDRTARTQPKEPRLPEHLYPYYVQLVQNEVAEELAEKLLRAAAARVPAGDADQKTLRATVRDYIAGMLPESGGIELSAGVARRVALVGPSGSGKTTTLAKLATHFKLRLGKRVALLSLDTQRMAAHEQLRRYAELIEVPLHTAQTIAEVKLCLKSLSEIDLLLIDTPGVGLSEQGRFARLATLLRAARPDEKHLVLPASLTPDVQARVAGSFAPLGISRAVLTRLDDAVGLGVILNVTQRLNLGLSYVTTGQNVPNDIEEACGRRVAALLLAADD